ncbi:MAG: transketolase [Nitrosomonadales bacterium]|nr:transketolase [Nitrosomonadales bacterium]
MTGIKKLTAKHFSAARKRLLQMHFESGVGHIGGNLSALDAMLVVFHEYLSGEDKFILSKGHSAGALYTTLWSLGRLNEQDLKQFHQDDTLLAAHPPAQGIEDIQFATGSLGHGLSLAAGTALAFKLKGNATRVVCLTSDGEWQEGSTWEALIFACHHRLFNLTVMVDHNNLQGFGSTAEVASMSPLWDRLQGFDVDVQIIDGHDPDAIRTALEGESKRLRVIVLRTVKGHGVSFMENRMEWHYLPLSEDQFKTAIEEIERKEVGLK